MSIEAMVRHVAAGLVFRWSTAGRRLSELGQGRIELALILAVIAIISIAALLLFGGQVSRNHSVVGMSI